MNKQLTFLLALTFLFLYPSISFSQTFKCEFVREKFDGGKKNIGSCSGDPEIVTKAKRTKHCEVSDLNFYSDIADYTFDLNSRTIFYTAKHFHRGKKNFERLNKADILSVHSFTEKLDMDGKDNENNRSTSYLITYKEKSSRHFDYIYTLYIPQNGKSIISEYHSNSSDTQGNASWVGMRFGKCVNTSN